MCLIATDIAKSLDKYWSLTDMKKKVNCLQGSCFVEVQLLIWLLNDMMHENCIFQFVRILYVLDLATMLTFDYCPDD